MIANISQRCYGKLYILIASVFLRLIVTRLTNFSKDEVYGRVDEEPEKITLVRAGKDVVNVFVWKCQNLTKSLEIEK